VPRVCSSVDRLRSIDVFEGAWSLARSTALALIIMMPKVESARGTELLLQAFDEFRPR
jgi:hypothetical protein